MQKLKSFWYWYKKTPSCSYQLCKNQTEISWPKLNLKCICKHIKLSSVIFLCLCLVWSQSPQTMWFFLTRLITGAKMSCWRGPLVGTTYLPELGWGDIKLSDHIAYDSKKLMTNLFGEFVFAVHHHLCALLSCVLPLWLTSPRENADI